MQKFPARLLIMPAPKNVIVEAASGCNFRCPLCYEDTLKRKHGLMKLGVFKAFVDDVEGFVKQISLDFAGEPTLNPYLFEMIGYAQKKGIDCLIMTNCSLLHKYIDGIFDSKLKTLYFAFDGMTEKTYKQYRVGGNFKQVKKNIETVCKEKKKRGSKYPKLVLQFIVMKHNEHEIPELIKFAKELNIDEVHLKSCGFSSETEKKTGGLKQNEQEVAGLAKKFLPKNKKFVRYEDDRNVRKDMRAYICQWLLQSTILWNGDVTTCCVDYEGHHVFGNIINASFREMWNSTRFKKIRKLILNKNLPLCRTCRHVRAGNFETVIKLN